MKTYRAGIFKDGTFRLNTNVSFKPQKFACMLLDSSRQTEITLYLVVCHKPQYYLKSEIESHTFSVVFVTMDAPFYDTINVDGALRCRRK